MYLESLKAGSRSFTVRLSAWYALTFTISAALLFTFLYFLLTAALDRKDHDVIETRLKLCAVIYERGGLPALQQFVERSREAERSRTFFVRVASATGTALLLNVPEDWVQFDASALRPGGDLSHLVWLRIPKDEESDVTLALVMLPDGSRLEVGRRTNSRESILKPFRLSFWSVMTPALMLGILGGGFLAYRSTRPVREVVATARSIIDTGDLSARVKTSSGQTDMEELARQFNRVLDKNQRLIQGMREALDNVAHDLRTPLARLRGIAEVGVQVTPDVPAREALADCVEEADTVLTMLTTLMDITEAETGVMQLNRQTVSIAALLSGVLDMYQLIAEEKRITIDVQVDPALVVAVDAIRIRQVFANLLDNALKYTAEGGTIKIAAAALTDEVLIEFKDSGMGISRDEQSRIWDRLYRGDKSRSQRGLGLGLSLVKAIIEAHHGSVAVTSEVGVGSSFSAALPNAGVAAAISRV
jgi:signal transduction histidine kinase